MLYRFTGGDDGGQPGSGQLIFDQAGNLYGTTQEGGSRDNGMVYKLMQSDNGWTESVLYSFTGGTATARGPDGGEPRVRRDL